MTMPSARLCLAQIAVSAMDRTQLVSRIEDAVGFRPRPGQVEAVHKLVVDQQDLILIAPTGWGKSVVFQAVPALSGGICIMIMPLTLLEEDQVSLLFWIGVGMSYRLSNSFEGWIDI